VILKNKKLVVALSGGVDSVVLLHYLRDYNLRAIHINHNLSPYAHKWQGFCINFCQSLNIDLQIYQLNIDSTHNLEARARALRYQVLFANMTNDEILLTAHHQDDQAETVLLNLSRGAGVLGLSAMPEIKNRHYRPFLQFDKTWIYNYAKQYQLNYIEDESNLDNSFRRNFMRNQVLPLLKTNYPQITKSLNQVAIGQQNSLKLNDDLAKIDIQNHNLVQDGLLNVENLKQLADYRVFNIIYYHLRNLNFDLPSKKITRQIYNALFSADDAKVFISWAKFCCRKFNGFLYFLTQDSTTEFCPIYDKLKNEPRLKIKYRQGGEYIKFKHKTHSQSLKKVLQEKKIPPWQRDKLRMYYLENELVAIEKIGFL
jgi:tRNA(Ile)-lysidine synthase